MFVKGFLILVLVLVLVYDNEKRRERLRRLRRLDHVKQNIQHSLHRFIDEFF